MIEMLTQMCRNVNPIATSYAFISQWMWEIEKNWLEFPVTYKSQKVEIAYLDTSHILDLQLLSCTMNIVQCIYSISKFELRFKSVEFGLWYKIYTIHFAKCYFEWSGDSILS